MILLDTCALLWLAGGARDRLSETALETIRRHRLELCVSAISALEIGIKAAKGALALSLDPATWFASALETHGVREIAVDGRIAATSTMLPRVHADPCDRIIVATALRYDAVILSPDEALRAYRGTNCRW